MAWGKRNDRERAMGGGGLEKREEKCNRRISSMTTFLKMPWDDCERVGVEEKQRDMAADTS